MQESKSIVLIITTRNYPLSGWEDSKELDWNLEQLDFDDKSNLSDSCVHIHIKTLRFNSYSVYVVPCLEIGNTVTNDDRRKFLELLITTICPDPDKGYDAYLFAHDRDFNKCHPGVLVNKSDIPEGDTAVPRLSKLINAKRVYMFQHDGQIRKILAGINDFSEDSSKPLFGEDQCKELVEIVDGERIMCEFFQGINSDSNNRYPDIN